MALSRGAQKVDRVTLTLHPTSEDNGLRNIPTTFRLSNRTYAWQEFGRVEYMLVPRRVSHEEVQVDIYIGNVGKAGAADVNNLVRDFVKSKLGTEWKGLELASIGRVVEEEPPNKPFKRSTIEEIMGARIEP